MALTGLYFSLFLFYISLSIVFIPKSKQQLLTIPCSQNTYFIGYVYIPY